MQVQENPGTSHVPTRQLLRQSMQGIRGLLAVMLRQALRETLWDIIDMTLLNSINITW